MDYTFAICRVARPASCAQVPYPAVGSVRQLVGAIIVGQQAYRGVSERFGADQRPKGR